MLSQHLKMLRILFEVWMTPNELSRLSEYRRDIHCDLVA